MASRIRRLAGRAKKPSVFDKTKNMRAAARRSIALLAPGRVARLRLLVGRIKAGQLGPTLDLAHDPALIELVLGAFMRDELDEILRNDDGAVVVEDDHITRENRTAP